MHHNGAQLRALITYAPCWCVSSLAIVAMHHNSAGRRGTKAMHHVGAREGRGTEAVRQCTMLVHTRTRAAAVRGARHAANMSVRALPA